MDRYRKLEEREFASEGFIIFFSLICSCGGLVIIVLCVACCCKFRDGVKAPVSSLEPCLELTNTLPAVSQAIHISAAHVTVVSDEKALLQ